jgi:hypothetical protein
MSSPPPPPPPPPAPPAPHHHPHMIHRNFGYRMWDYPRYRWYNDWTPSVYVMSDTKKDEMNYVPIALVGGIAVIALIVSLQKK